MLRAALSWSEYLPYKEIDQFLDVCEQLPGHGVISHLELATTAGIYAEVFGKNNIGFCFQEQLAQQPAAFMDSLCGFLDIGSAEALSLIDGRRKNDRITEAELNRIKRLTASRILKIPYSIAWARGETDLKVFSPGKVIHLGSKGELQQSVLVRKCVAGPVTVR